MCAESLQILNVIDFKTSKMRGGLQHSWLTVGNESGVSPIKPGIFPIFYEHKPWLFSQETKENKTNRTSYCVAIQFLTNIDRLEGLPGINTRALFFYYSLLVKLWYHELYITFLKMAGGQGLWKLPHFYVCFFFKQAILIC